MKDKVVGFILNRLILSNGITTREVEFYKEVNIISGPTDTGKTYIYQLIKHLFGSNDKLKEIPENKNFNNAFLEIYSRHTRTIFTLKRTIGTNKVHIYEYPFSEIDKTTQSQSFNTKGSSKIISRELMQYAGLIDQKQLKTNIRKETYQNINFRDFLFFSMVDEIGIIKDKSILYSGQYTSKTFELNLFYYLISNEINNYMTLQSDSKQAQKKNVSIPIVKNQKENSVLDLIRITQEEINDLEKQSNTSEEISYKEEFSFITAEITTQTEKLQKLFNSIEQIKSQKLMHRELLKRFSLLKEQFESDLDRLDFILEGGGIISNLLVENCLVCGGKINDFNNHIHLEISENNIIDGDTLLNSYKSEKQKIYLNLKDLKKTIDGLKDENENLNSNRLKIEEEYEFTRIQINNELKPTQQSIKEKISKEVEKRLINQKIIYLKKMLSTLGLKPNDSTLDQISHIVTDTSLSVNIDELIYKPINELCNIMRDYLVDMNFLGENIKHLDVAFNFEEHDFIVDGKSRSVYGKGFRAIIYSVFLISFMKYCQKKKLPHVGFVIIDSPLTTYQDGQDNNDEDNAPEELKTRFIKTFAKEKENQIIIIDNQFPMDTEEIHLVEFTKNKNEGRYGFM